MMGKFLPLLRILAEHPRPKNFRDGLRRFCRFLSRGVWRSLRRNVRHLSCSSSACVWSRPRCMIANRSVCSPAASASAANRPTSGSLAIASSVPVAWRIAVVRPRARPLCPWRSASTSSFCVVLIRLGAPRNFEACWPHRSARRPHLANVPSPAGWHVTTCNVAASTVYSVPVRVILRHDLAIPQRPNDVWTRYWSSKAPFAPATGNAAKRSSPRSTLLAVSWPSKDLLPE